MRLHAPQVVTHQFAQLHSLLLRQVLPTLQQTPPRVLEHFPAALTLQFPGFLCPHLIELFVKLLHHVKSIQNVHRPRGLLRAHLHVVTPHVRADELQSRERAVRNRFEKSSQTLLCPVLPNVQQTPTVGINLVHQRQVLVTPAISDFIDADRFHRFDFAMNYAPADDPLHRPKHRVPTRPEDRRGLLPAQSLGPAGQKDSVTVSRAVLAIGPGDSLDGHAAARAIDASHAVQEEHRKGPQRDELESPLAQRVVLGPLRPHLLQTGRPRPMGLDVDKDFAAVVGETSVAVNETLLLFNAAEDSPELHLVRCEA